MGQSVLILTQSLTIRGTASPHSLGSVVVNARTSQMILVSARQLPNLFQIQADRHGLFAVLLAHASTLP